MCHGQGCHQTDCVCVVMSWVEHELQTLYKKALRYYLTMRQENEDKIKTLGLQDSLSGILILKLMQKVLIGLLTK